MHFRKEARGKKVQLQYVAGYLFRGGIEPVEDLSPLSRYSSLYVFIPFKLFHFQLYNF